MNTNARIEHARDRHRHRRSDPYLTPEELMIRTHPRVDGRCDRAANQDTQSGTRVNNPQSRRQHLDGRTKSPSTRSNQYVADRMYGVNMPQKMQNAAAQKLQ